ncbi:PfkB family carbohydrate kinase [Caulobacter sp. BK020]|uniref:carbohydrate kinase family protein n=1 Tax=Caulobacter sp. BK020 TaxID=2512117 RepID=UPI0010DA872D|nr:PfkB family carbohydrate kinase [Caulobacter sp. BK020]TCS11898.1 sugar/nucleoside kinase (ribokinase family) [Caulobacter sp. BK020]
MNNQLLAIGLTTLDIVARAIDQLPAAEGAVLIEGAACAPAGTAAACAMIASRLGLKAGLISAVGDDMTGRLVRHGLETEGVDVGRLAVLPGFPTSTTLLPIDSRGGRPVLHAPGAGSFTEVGPEDHAALAGAGFVHYGGIGGLKLDGGAGAAFLAAAKAVGAVVTCDLIAPQPSALAELERVLPHIDYFMPSAVEARGLTGLTDLSAAADRFIALGAKACIIKNGEEGALLAVDGAKIVVPAHVVEVVDTTSCGDSFCAGFIVGLSRGWTPLEACRLAAATAALVAQGLATFGRLIDFESTAAAMSLLPLREAA